MADPFSFPDPLAFLDRDPLAPRRRQAAYPSLSEVDTDTAIQRLTRGSLSGLGYVGSLLDKMTGARALRGLAGSHPRELLSLLPFSDTVGLTDPEQIVSGEQLATPAYRAVMGHAPAEGNWAERNLVGPAVEIGLDPATYLGGIGPLTRLGKGLARTGQGTKGLLPAVRAGERSLHPLVGAVELGARGLGLSTRAEPVVQRAAASAVEGAGKLGRALNVGVLRKLPLVAPVEDIASAVGKPLLEKAVLTRRALFDPRVGFTTNRAVQGAMEDLVTPAREAGTKELLRRGFDFRAELADLARQTGTAPGLARRFVTQLGENVPADLPPGIVGPHRAEEFRPFAERLRQFGGPEALDVQRQAGLSPSELQPQIDLEYFLRQKARAPGGALERLLGSLGVGRAKQLSTRSGSYIRRKDALGNWLGGAQAVEDLLESGLPGIKPTALAGRLRTLPTRQVTRQLLAEQLGRLGTGPGGIPLAPETIAATGKRAASMSRLLKTVPLERVAGGIPGAERVPFYLLDPVANAVLSRQRALGTSTAARGIFDVVRRAYVTPAKAQAVDVPLTKLVGDVGLSSEEGLRRMLGAVGMDDPFLTAHLQAKALGLPPGAGLDVPGEFRKLLEGYALPPAEARAAGRLLNRWQVPEELQPVLHALDTMLGAFKTGTYSLWPGSLLRNIASGREENLLMGGVSPISPMYGRWKAAASGAPVAMGIPAMTGTPAEQYKALLRETSAYPFLGGHGQGDIADVVGKGVQAALPFDPLAPREGYLQTLAQGPRSLREKGWKGLMDIGPISRRVGGIAEERLRMPEYMHLRAQGILPDVAADLVEKSHFNYENLSDFEKSTLKRLVPFYTYSRRNVPKQVERAITRPGITEGPIRFSGAAGGGDGEGYVPEYLRAGLALPVGSPAEGTQRYLSQLGLPFEEALGRLKMGRTPFETAARTGEGLMGMLRPELRVLLEGLTGRQFFTGRDLADLHVGKTERFLGAGSEDTSRFLSQLISATPASRGISTLNRLLDQRKYGAMGPLSVAEALPLATGARLTDVDVQKWRAIDARHRLEELMAAEPALRKSTDYYASPEARMAGEVTPLQGEMLRLYAALKLRAREAAKERRVGVQSGGR